MSQLPDNLPLVLNRLGRSSTPAVPETPFGITLGQLIGTQVQTNGTVLIIGTSELFRFLSSRNIQCTLAIPGTTAEQAADTNVVSLLIEADSFYKGAWLGADNGTSSFLVEEIFEAGRLLRARGGLVYLIPSKRHRRGPAYLKIESTTTTNLDEIPEIDLEEQAPQSIFWKSILEYLDSPLRMGNHD
ncbi:hypothetical protein [Rothia nasimurium]|uniref:hypothetical protein n=1 Tax=Rothia nasimurium TaxID=85336 RepID=UPI001F170875|nr:hypothetical protein [Rothia nasimurium]